MAAVLVTGCGRLSERTPGRPELDRYRVTLAVVVGSDKSLSDACAPAQRRTRARDDGDEIWIGELRLILNWFTHQRAQGPLPAGTDRSDRAEPPPSRWSVAGQKGVRTSRWGLD